MLQCWRVNLRPRFTSKNVSVTLIARQQRRKRRRRRFLDCCNTFKAERKHQNDSWCPKRQIGLGPQTRFQSFIVMDGLFTLGWACCKSFTEICVARTGCLSERNPSWGKISCNKTDDGEPSPVTTSIIMRLSFSRIWEKFAIEENWTRATANFSRVSIARSRGMNGSFVVREAVFLKNRGLSSAKLLT